MGRTRLVDIASMPRILLFVLLWIYMVESIKQMTSQSRFSSGGQNDVVWSPDSKIIDSYNGRWRNTSRLFGNSNLTLDRFAQVGDDTLSPKTGLYKGYCSLALVSTEFQFSIPSFAQIDGLVLNFTLQGHSFPLQFGRPCVHFAGLIRNQTLGEAENEKDVDIADNPTVYMFGSSKSTIDSWDPSEINDQSFGSALVTCNWDNNIEHPLNPRAYLTMMTVYHSWNVSVSSVKRIFKDSSNSTAILDIFGVGFVDLGKVTSRLGDSESSCTIISINELQCGMPSQGLQNLKSYQVSVSLDGITWTDDPITYLYESSSPSAVSTTPLVYSSETSRLALILALSIGLSVLVVIAVMIPIILAIRRRYHSYNFEEKEPPEFGELKWNSQKSERPEYRASANHVKCLDQLENLILNSDTCLLMTLFRQSTASESEDVAKALVVVYMDNGRINDLVKEAITYEVTTTESDSLFRANSLTPRLFSQVSFLMGMEYLYFTVGKYIDSIREKHENVLVDSRNSAEVDPSKLSEGEDLSINKLQLQLYCQKILVAILNSVDACPMEIRRMCFDLRSSLNEKSGANAYEKMAGNFVFLRFVCPALLAPELYGIMSSPPNSTVQRQLVLVAKVLQNLANGVSFGKKEEFMSPLNSFIEDNQSKMSDYYRNLSNLPQEVCVSSSIRVPEAHRRDYLAFLHAQLHALRPRLQEDEISTETLAKIDELLLIPPAERTH